MTQKLVRLILKEVEHGRKKRYQVTNRLRNYPKEDKLEAIKFCISGGLVSLSEELVDGPGVNPVYVSITDKGVAHLSEICDKIGDGSIWSA